MDRHRRLDETRQSWDHATRLHNAHKRDQAAFLRADGSTLFPEERELLGELRGRRLLHLLCNSGQDTLSLAARGASCVGVDLSPEAVSFARQLSTDSGIPAAFHQAEVFAFLEGELERASFDLVFASYGALPWIDDVKRLFTLVRDRLAPGGRVVLLEFHPLAWSFDERFQLADPYFAPGRVFTLPVSDYVGESGASLAPSGFVAQDAPPNPHAAHAFQHTVADIVTAAIEAGLTIEALREWPYANGCRLHAGLVAAEGARFTTPPGVPSLPLMLGVVARR
ncbi:MAG: class I SAM-dependent methyltransferase [Deltaproteobacteria bacterium]|nr:class I SAM-dependent methyltransferase [Deltaproteobacteria bacterium]